MRNTYMLLAMCLGVSVLTAGAAVALRLPHPGILLKNGSLSNGEWEIMKTHAQKGYEIVSTLPGMETAADLVRNHEERFDGTGYPRGLAGNDIPFGARLFAIIDTLDAITSDRLYRKGLNFDVAKEEICRMSGKQFDPVAVGAFLAEEVVLRKMAELKCTGPDPALDQRAV